MPIQTVTIGQETIGIRHRAGGPSDFELWASMGEYPIYDAYLYEEMTTDAVRNHEYRLALERVVPGKVVLDVGTGADMVWALAAVAAGARKVYAIEEIESAYRAAEARVAAAGLGDRITLIRGNAMRVTLPEPAEVCVSEIIGNIGSSEGAAAVLHDTRKRLLKPGAVMIPWRCVTEIAAFSLPDAFAGMPHFTSRAVPYVERILERFGGRVDLRLCCRNVPPQSLLSKPDVFEDLDFEAEAPLPAPRQIALRIERAGRLDGFLMWIRLFCTEGAAAIDSLESATNWRLVFFPTFFPGVPVEPGDTIVANVETTLSPDGIHPNYQMVGRLVRSSGTLPFEHQSLHNLEAQCHGLPIYRALFPAERAERP